MGNQVRAKILGLTTAHICIKLTPGAPETVGRVASANQGSVSLTLDMGTTPANAAWWQQTQYGTMAWLAVADRIIREHDGAIAVQSAVGKGTTFTICLATRPGRSV